MLQKLGAEVVGEAMIETETGKEKLWMIKINLLNPFPSLSMLKAMAQSKVRQPSPAL